MFARYKKKIFLSVIIGAAFYLAFSIYADFDKLLSALFKFNWMLFPLILAFSFANYLFRYFKWDYYLRVLKIKVPFKINFLIFLSAFVMSVTPGKMGEVLKSFLLKEEKNIPVSQSAPIIFAERITDFISMILLCIFGAYFFNYGRDIVIIISVFFFLLLVFLSNRKIFLLFVKILEKIKFIKKHIAKVHTAYDSISLLIKLKPLIISVLISLVSWFMECLGFYFVIIGFSNSSLPDINILSATFIYAFSTLVGAVAMLPGGVGVTEATITGLLVFMKIPKEFSVASTILIRLATLWFAVLVGIVAIFIYQHISNKNIEKLSTYANDEVKIS